MQREEERTFVQAVACECVDVDCVKSDAGLELLLRFYPAGATAHIAFAIPIEDAEDLARMMLRHVERIAPPDDLN